VLLQLRVPLQRELLQLREPLRQERLQQQELRPQQVQRLRWPREQRRGEAVQVPIGGGATRLPLARLVPSGQLRDLEDLLEPFC